ncbi:DUF2271 domain-containing protein [Novilysobacter spongiicola]|jgi:hypothetical protein|uniref:DUF2271 domain-containing protein n=1 Tax=Lysobacter spongiicola DSM 21749 TaxID=1122188 RepID=A0A1T4P6P8_9GAMM|nr:DUF2271 domain-containing protein [Lysobacter spongiicola]SJZ87007.1 Hypothetical protein SAMN02745674_01107 [Lysobacter spongiicola DSM 21749]
MIRSARLLPRAGLLLALLLPASLPAAGLDVTLEIPRLNVAEYHRPYVAVWIERPDHSVAANLAVWYDDDMKGDEGTKWLKDMRQWWRRSGRTLTMPVDGVSGATRPVGQHQLRFDSAKAPLKGLAPGKYELIVEAAREVGGREVVRIPFQWPAASAQQLKASGDSELGEVRLSLKP